MGGTSLPENVRAGYVYLVMASFGTLALLLTFGLLAGPAGGYAFADIRAACAVENVAVDQRAYNLFDEQRYAAGALRQEMFQRAQTLIWP